MSRRDSSASSRASGRAGGKVGPRVRSDGKVDVYCPQCDAHYRVAEENLEAKITCTECHRTFFAKTGAGKHGRQADNSKTYVMLGLGAVVVIGSFVVMSRGGREEPKAMPVVTKPAPPDLARNARIDAILAWAKGITTKNEFTLRRSTDFAAMQKQLGVAGRDWAQASGSERDEIEAAVLAALYTHDATRYLRELELADGGQLDDEASLKGDSGTAQIYAVPRAGDKDYDRKFNAIYQVSFRIDGGEVKVTGTKLVGRPKRLTRDPNLDKLAYKPHSEIAKRETVEIADGAGARKVYESKPGPLGHYQGASVEMQKLADGIVADLLQSADPEAPGTLFNKATGKVTMLQDPKQRLETKKAVVPRILNAMNDCYADVNANNMKLSQLDRALRGFTGFAVNYDVRGTGDAQKDKALRESCVRQWFAFWYRYANGELKEFIEETESLDAPPAEEPKKAETAPKK